MLNLNRYHFKLDTATHTIIISIKSTTLIDAAEQLKKKVNSNKNLYNFHGSTDLRLVRLDYDVS